MKDIAIYGAGGLGRETACIINNINKKIPTWNLLGFFDDGAGKGTCNEYGEILGGIDDLNQWSQEINIIMAIGSGAVVKKIVEKVFNSHVTFPNIFYGTYFADEKNTKFGIGNIISSTVFSCAVEVGDFNLFNGAVTVGHDSKIDSYNTFMPAVRISGEVKIGCNNFFGVASIVLQQIKIGNNFKLGAGSVLMHKPKDDSLYIGNPAKLFKY